MSKYLHRCFYFILSMYKMIFALLFLHLNENMSNRTHRLWVYQVVLVVKNLHANAGEIRGTSSISGSGRPPGGGHGNPLQFSCL